jgi:hypothetical protein
MFGFLPMLAGGVASLLGAGKAKKEAQQQWDANELNYKRGWTANKEAGRQSYLRDIAGPGNARFRMGSLLGLGRLYGAMGGKGKGPATLIKYFEQMRNPYEYVEPTYVPGENRPSGGLGLGDFARALVTGASYAPGPKQYPGFNQTGGRYTYQKPWEVGPPPDEENY